MSFSLRLRSCFSSVVVLRSTLSPLPFARRLSFLPSPLFTSPRTNPTLAMSAPPSAFDALMSRARAASSLKKKSTSDAAAPSSPPSKKRSENPKTGDGEDRGGEKKLKGLTVEEKRAQLKSRIGNLKKKPADFDPRSVACWEDGERVPFLFLCLAFDMISNESGRIVMTDIVCNMLRTIIKTTPDDLVGAVYLAANRVAPAHEGVELGIGDASIIKALAEACGGKEAHIKTQYKEKGDLGLVAKGCRSSQRLMRKPAALTIAKVFDTFRIIAKESGMDSQKKKINHF